MSKVLVTPRSLTRKGHPELERLKQEGFDIVFCTPGKQPSEEELLEILPGCVGYLAGVETISANVLEAAKELKVISRNGTGIDNIDVNAAEKLNIKVCRTEGANARGVAELTIGLIFSIARNIPKHDHDMKDQHWEREKGVELEGKTLGLVGCGKIGKQVAALGLGLGMEVLAYRRHPDRSFSPSDQFSYVSFEELVTRSDIISLHRPASPDRKPVIDSGVIGRMKQGVCLVNTARASLIDDAAALKGLEDGKIAGMGVDVYEQEPPRDCALVKHPRVVATPHTGGYTQESVFRATRDAVDNLINNL
ncbi:MAG: phosphoglycerate dehydrogenase [Spirochaetota bacterium]